MAVDFPLNPTINQTYTGPNGQVWQFIAPGVWAAQSGVAAFPLMGVTDGSNAPTGQVGEVISAINVSGVALTAATPANVTSLSFPPGDWDVSGEVAFGGLAAAWSTVIAGDSTVSATFPALAINAGRAQLLGGTGSSAGTQYVPLPTHRINVSVATTYYLVAQVNASSGTTASGIIWARRAR